MTVAKYETMNLNELRRYVLTHREDIEAFNVYIDRSKSEGRMRSLNLNDENWEDTIKQAIKYSSNAIRWYCDKTVENSVEVQTITQWWSKLDNKLITKYHITALEINRETGIWEANHLHPPVQLRITEPRLEKRELTTLVQYRDQNNSVHQIEAVAIDLDIAKQNLFIWPTQTVEVFIFSAETA